MEYPVEAGETSEANTTKTEAQLENDANENEDSPNQGRVKRKPTHLEDYVANQVEIEEELNLISLAQIEDPLTFEETVKDVKWRQAMNSEIESTEKKTKLGNQLNCHRMPRKLELSGYSRQTSMKLMRLKNIKLDWWPKASHRSMELIIGKCFLQ